MPLSNVKNTLIVAQNPVTTLQIHAPFHQSNFMGLAETQLVQWSSNDQEVGAFHCLQSKFPEAFRMLNSELLWMLFVNACVKFATAFDEQVAFC